MGEKIKHDEDFYFNLSLYRMRHPLSKTEDILDIKSICDDNLFKIYFEDGQINIYDPYNNYQTRYVIDNSDQGQKNRFKFILQTFLSHRAMSQRELADKTNINIHKINRYLTGKQLPDYISLMKIAEVFDCKIDDLYF